MTTPKKKPPKDKAKKPFHVILNETEQRDLKKCARLKLDDPQADYAISPRAVIGWALRKCAAEAQG